VSVLRGEAVVRAPAGSMFRCILADPPWDYAGRSPPWRTSTDAPYKLMPLADICSLPVATISTNDAHLYLWAVLPMMREAYQVIDAWGFTPETVLTWCKPGVGLGGGFRGNTEHLIVARRGWSSVNPTCAACGGRARGAKKCACLSPEWRVKGEPIASGALARASFRTTASGTWYEIPRSKHSEKPEFFVDLIEQMSPSPRIELFARRRRLGWSAWGDEVGFDVELGWPDMTKQAFDGGAS